MQMSYASPVLLLLLVWVGLVILAKLPGAVGRWALVALAILYGGATVGFYLRNWCPPKKGILDVRLTCILESVKIPVTVLLALATGITAVKAINY
jgi:hypothetical protein